MRVILVRPPFIDLRFGPPIGLAYLSKTLQEAGHEAITYDINREIAKHVPVTMDNYTRDFTLPEDHPSLEFANERFEEYCEVILSDKPDTVGIYLSYSTVEYGNRIAREVSKHVRCIGGGPAVTWNSHSLFETGYFKALVIGYGEEAILDALGRDGIIKKSLLPGKEYLPDLTDIPIGDYHGILPVVTTRGCPHRCRFCTQNYPYYYHAIDSIVKQVNETKNIKKVIYNDSNINVNTRRTEILFNALSKSSKKPFGHIFGMQIKKGHEKYIPEMAGAGIKEVRIGLESGSLRERRSMNKVEFTNSQALAFIKNLCSHRIKTFVQYIFCYPDQTEKDRQETIDFMYRINDACDPSYVKHILNKFVVHQGKEDYFRKQYGVITQSPRNWSNSLYNSRNMPRIYQRTLKLIPGNCQIYL